MMLYVKYKTDTGDLISVDNKLTSHNLDECIIVINTSEIDLSKWNKATRNFDDPSPTTKITKLAFRNRFKPEEKVALELASKDDPNGLPEKRKNAAMIRVYLDDLSSAIFIDLTRKDTVAAVHLLEQIGLLDAGRAAEILSLKIESHEVYEGQ